MHLGNGGIRLERFTVVNGRATAGKGPAASDRPWPPCTRLPALGRDDVHLWRAVLEVNALSLCALERTLADDERVRAGRLAFRRDRERFIVARGTLRSLLGHYLGLAPEEVRFAYGPRGKPELSAQGEGAPLRFNVTHSSALALFAFARGRALGVDIERIHADFLDDQVAERFFAPREIAALRALPASQWPRAFFRCWTRKEAYIKAKGDGLSMALDSFAVSLAADRVVPLWTDDQGEARRWLLVDVPIDPEFAAALAIEVGGHRKTHPAVGAAADPQRILPAGCPPPERLR
jgi:4'-phosphopantetheinyl transferase